MIANLRCAALSLSLLLAGFGWTQPVARALQPGRPVEDSLIPEQVTSFQIDLSADQYARLTIDKTDLAIVARVIAGAGSQGVKEIEVESTEDDDPTVCISIVSGSSGGSYRLEIELRAPPENDARYRVSLSEPTPARVEDKKRAAAERAYAQAEQHRADRSADALRQRLPKYQAALELWRTIGDSKQEGLTLSRMGAVDANLGETAKALDYLRHALALSRTNGDIRLEANTLASLGLVAQHRGDLRQALDHYLEALPLLKQVNNRRGETSTLLNIGVTYADMGDPAKAVDWYEQALPLAHGLPDRSREANALANISAAYRQLGELQKGMDYLQRGLEMSRVAGDRQIEAAILRMVGAALYDRSEFQGSLDYYSRALLLQHDLGDVRQEAITQASMALAYERLGDSQKALDYFRQSLALRLKSQDRRGQAISIAHIGLLHAEEGEAQQALSDYQQALALHRAVSNRKGEADTLAYIGDTCVAMNKLQEAVDHYMEALSFYRSAGHVYEEIDALTRLGAVEVSLHETETAFGYLNRALERAHALGSAFQEADALFNLARAERAQNRPAEALVHINNALDLTERVRGTVAGPDVRASYLAKVRGRYEFLVGLLMELNSRRPHEGFDGRALEATERARARGLLDWLAESHVDIRQGVDPGLVEQERLLQATLQAKAAYRIQLFSGEHPEPRTSAVDKEIAALTRRYEETEAQIRAHSPRYAALTQPQPLAISDIHRLLDSDTTLLDYALGDERSVLWLVTSDALNVYELPGRARIEDAVRRAYAELSVTNSARRGEATAALSRMVLGPIIDRLTATPGANKSASSPAGKRLAIVADGALQYVPFAALPGPKGLPLLATHEIVNLPSASVLAVLRRDAEHRSAAPKLVAVLADPVFDRDDPRVADSRQSALLRRPLEDRLVRSAQESGLLKFDRLFASRGEATTILNLGATVAGRSSSLGALDFDASRTTATSGDLSQYQIVHFASHTLLNSQHPQLSGIVLSLVDRQGRPEDGFLQVHEIFNLKLNADLVVLSACQTALGKDIWGEGLVGLTRAFMYAGAPRVVASLWQVPDRATAELMKRFYARMLLDGLRPAAALRSAQLELSKQRHWAAPYYWAGFTLQGDWR